MVAGLMDMTEKRAHKWKSEGQRLKQGRRQAGLSQYEVAEHLEVNRHVVWYWETGRSLPTPHHIRKLAALYGVTIDWLLEGEAKFLAETKGVYSTKELPPTEEEVSLLKEYLCFLRWRREHPAGAL